MKNVDLLSIENYGVDKNGYIIPEASFKKIDSIFENVLNEIKNKIIDDT